MFNFVGGVSLLFEVVLVQGCLMALMASPCPSSTNCNTTTSTAKNTCKWSGCTNSGPYETVQELADHVTNEHVELFNVLDFAYCLWEGCKVYNRIVQKKGWLSQHMRRHTNERPHKCLMNGCNQSFWNVETLNNHLQLHLEPSPPQKLKKSKKRLKSANSHSFPLMNNSTNSLTPPPLKKFCNGTVSDDESSSQSDTKKKRPLSLKVRIPLHSSIKFSSAPCTSPLPIPVNGNRWIDG